MKKKIDRDTIIENKVEFLKDIIDSDSFFRKKNILPYGGHWLFFNQSFSKKDTGKDGHPKRGKFLPALKGYKRMFAGANLNFKNDILFGANLKKISYIKSIIEKKKNNNKLYFAKVLNKYFNKEVECLDEIQTLVFVNNNYKTLKKKKIKNKSLDIKFVSSKSFIFSTIELFKYSALTFNSHRIHYDLKYAKGVEGYKNLLVHGPLLATKALDEINKVIKSKLKSFHFSIIRPVFVNEKFLIKIYNCKLNKKKFFVFIINKSSEELAFKAEAFLI